MADSRKKGCPNPRCKMNIKRVKQKSNVDYCPVCGERLVFVCSKCFCEIEDLGPKHKHCRNCEAIAADKKDKAKENVQKVAGVAGAAVVSAVAFVGKKGLDAVKKEAGAAVSDAAKTLARHIFKK